MNFVHFKITFVTVLLALCVLLTSFDYENKTVYSSNAKNNNKIALTFDDGPHPKITPKILDVLDEFGIKATFFVIGVNIDNYPAPLIRAVKEGHEIGNHTNSHSILKSMNKSYIREEIEACKEKVYDLTGYNVNLIRPPCGMYDDKMIDIARSNGDKIILWNIDTNDWAHFSTQRIVETVKNSVKGGDIILFHDYVSGENYTVEALKIIIPLLMKEGYEFVTVNQLLYN